LGRRKEGKDEKTKVPSRADENVAVRMAMERNERLSVRDPRIENN
jgi:hypothetical protein